MRVLLSGLLALLLLAACESASEGILTLDAEGVFGTTVFLDRNGDRVRTPNVDVPVQNARVALVRSQGDTVAAATTDAAGAARIADVPVGRYRVVVSGTALGDSLAVIAVDSAEVSIAANDSTGAVVTLGFRSATLAAVRSLPVGRVVSVEGVALHAPNEFGDATVHVVDSTGALRITAVPQAGIAAGDSARFTGRVATLAGVAVLEHPTVVALGKGTLPAPVDLTTREAAGARGGALDAALARIKDAQIVDAGQTAQGDVRLRLDDGSGSLEVLLDRDARIVAEVPLLPGAVVTATGVLEPIEGGSGWRLKPRSSADLVARIPDISIRDARATASGRLVAVHGVALTGWATFGDRTVHLADSTGAIRAVNVTSQFVTAGDSVRMVGQVGLQSGQPVLTQPTITVFGKGTLPAPVTVNAATATGARGGSLDAALVRVTGVRVDSLATAGPDLELRVRDGSGTLLVLLDASADAWGSAPALGTVLDLTGVLVPSVDPQRPTWALKPRSRADLTTR